MLKLGENIKKMRHSYHLTQQELAELVGVSKSSVSKWESGQTYPDLFLLPELATIFRMTLDELLGYEPQLSLKQIRAYYAELALAFAEEEFSSVFLRCQALCRRYGACFPFLLQMVVLLLNHQHLASVVEQSQIQQLALTLLREIKKDSANSQDISQASALESAILLQLGQFDDVIEILGVDVPPYFGENQLLAGAYAGLGQIEHAKEVLQVSLYQSLVEMIAHSGQLLSYYQSEPVKSEAVRQRTRALIQIFALENLHPYICLNYFLSELMSFVLQAEKESALAVIEEIIGLLSNLPRDLSLHGDVFFDQIDRWLTEKLALSGNLPRNQQVVNQSLLTFFHETPQLQSFFQDDGDFHKLVKQLDHILGVRA